MLFIKKTILVLLLPLLAFTTFHKYYVSVTQIEYVKKQQSVQIISRIFLDDFEDVLQARYNEKLFLGPQMETEDANFYIERYLKTKMIMKINGEEKTLNFIGKEYENDIVVCYLEIEGVKNIDTFEIENTVLFDLYAEQQTIVRTKINSKNKSFILIKENDKGLLNFK
ncbi:MAG TPA: peptidase E [Xanthomarina gelatinilytica]|uniref:Peptidase E n=1 Tax=Xanthomarina gelatinilytica TaxID=1137281 RepID=A0A3D6BQK0_9FLAO|nr:peptidase E [Xanthomarina gelatinilytica]